MLHVIPRRTLSRLDEGRIIPRNTRCVLSEVPECYLHPYNTAIILSKQHYRSKTRVTMLQLLRKLVVHCALSLAAQCIVIGAICLCVCLCVCVFVCGSVITITRNFVHRSSPNWVFR